MIVNLESQCVVDAEGCLANLNNSLSLGFPLCIPLPERTGKVAFVGSGPSVRDHLEELREWDGEVWAINGAYDYLLHNNIVSDGFIGVDPLPGLAAYVGNAQDQTVFYMSGLCDPTVFDALRGKNVQIWFPDQSSVKYPKGLWLVGGGTTAITRAPFLAKMLGWRDFTFFGADCSHNNSRYCYKDGTYADDSKQPINKIMIGDEGPFETEIPLLKQASQLDVIARYMQGCKIEFQCDGLLKAYLKAPIVIPDEKYAAAEASRNV